MLVFEGEVYKVSEVETLWKKDAEGKAITEISGFSQEVVLFVPAKLDEFDTITQREQVLPLRVWASKSSDPRFLPVGIIAQVKVGAYLEGRRFMGEKEVNGVKEKKEVIFLSLNLSRWKKIRDMKARPQLEAKISEGKNGQDDLPF